MSGVMDSYCWIHSTFSVSDSFRGEIDRESVRERRTDRQTDRRTNRQADRQHMTKRETVKQNRTDNITGESLSKTAWLVWLSRTIDSSTVDTQEPVRTLMVVV